MALERGRFTPIRVRNGPDGSLYVVDRADDPVVDSKPPSRSAAGTTSSVIRSRATSKGRILRVLGNDEGVEPARVANAAQPWEVAARFTSARGFWQDWAQRRWVEEASPASTRILAQWVSDHQRLVGNQDSTPASVRLRALWALEGQGRISAKILSNALEDPEPRVRSAALQILAEHPPGPVKDEAMAWVLQRSAAFPAATIPSLLICLGSAATPRTEALMRSILLSSRPSEWLEDAAISGLANRELRFLGQLVADPRCGAPQVTHARLFRLLGECLHQSGNPGEIDQARGLVQGLPRTDWRVLALNEGLLGPAAGRRTSADPPHPARAGPTDR
jgi:hypothetical protein